VNGELKDVAKGKIVNPKSQTVHTRPLDPALFKILLTRVLPGYEELDPPVQPQGAKEQMSLGGCLPCPMVWPKSQIHLGGVGGTTPTSAPQPLASTLGVQDIDGDEASFAQQDDPIGNDDGLNYYDQFITELRDDGAYMDPIDEPPYCGVDACEPTAPIDKAGCTKKRLFLSQETPTVDPSTQTK
jgi:hypothetical protein